MLRPKKPPPKVKDVKVRFSEDQYEAVVEAAQASGLEVAVYCRVAVMSDVLVPPKTRIRGNASPPVESSASPGWLEYPPKPSGERAA